MEETEALVWSGSPSRVLNLPVYVVCALLCLLMVAVVYAIDLPVYIACLLIVPIFYAIWKWLVLKNTRNELTTERLKLREGVLNKRLDEIELYRVRDYTLEQPLVLRLFGLSNITLGTADPSQPVVVLRAIKNGEFVLDQLRKYVEQQRVKKRVLPLDLAAP